MRKKKRKDEQEKEKLSKDEQEKEKMSKDEEKDEKVYSLAAWLGCCSGKLSPLT